MIASSTLPYKLTLKPEQVFMLSALVVNGGNYLYNLVLGRILGPEKFADAAILITLLMVLSFVAMTFQLSVTKFTAGLEGAKQFRFFSFIKKVAIICGIGLGAGIAFFAGDLQQIFQTNSKEMFYFFAAGVPVYFLMSTNRGYFQGNKSFYKLSFTYQTEMISRLVITLILVLSLKSNTSLLIAAGIFISFIFGLFPYQKSKTKQVSETKLEMSSLKSIFGFILITAFYELTQIIINNSDILLVKHYFEAYEAGLYASLALIGRMVYFVAWMFVMILLPTVVKLKKEGKDPLPVFFKYLSLISLLAGSIVVVTFFFPETIIQLMFGEAYITMAPLLWKYALATSIFAVSNVFVYYFLSLEKYLPVIISGVFGVSQVAFIVFFHQSLAQVVEVQIAIISFLLVIQLGLFFYQQKKKIHRK